MASHDVYYAHILSKNQRGYTEDMKNGRLNRALFAKTARRAMLLFAFAALGAQAATVATVNGTGYATLAEAVEAAKIGDTIKVIANDASLSAPEGWTISGSTLIPVDKTWHIANLDQLKEFQSAVNGGNTFDGQTVVLDVDIDMASEENWTPIGNAPEKKFAGTFDGQNHTISGLKITGGSYVGLFGYLGAATVQNVALVGANVSGVKRVGALVGQIAGNATIKNCSLDATSSVAGSDSNTGGLIGEASGSIVVTLENLTNNAPVTNTESGTSRAAGILCQATSGASVTLKNCVNNGTITTNDGYAGGIVSAKQGGASLVFDGCSNTGTLANGTKGTGALLAWSCNGSSVTISNYSADVANAIGWLSQDNYDHVFVINGVEHYIRVAKGGAGYTFASRYEAARMMDESYLQEIIGFFNYAKTVNANFAGYPATPVEVLKSAYNTRDESIKGGLFNTDVSSGWPQLLSQYNATSGKSLTADDFAVTWGTRDVLFMVGGVVVTDTASAQAALDAATPNTTIIFKAGTYGPLFIRQTLEMSTRREDLDKDGSYPAYLRSFKNLTLIAEEGAKVISKGITAEAGLFWYDSAPASNQAEMNRATSGFISYLALENVTIDGIAFDSSEQSAVTLRDNGAVATRGNIMVDGLTIQNCTGRGVASNKNIHFLAAGAGTNDQNFPGTEKKAFNNLVVKNCELDSYYQPIAFNNATAVLNGLTVTGNTFSKNGNSNVLQLSNKVNSGAFVIENNLFKDLNGRVVRATNSTANWTITGNRLDKPIMYDDSGEYDLVKINVKAETVGTAVTELDNDWNVGTLVNGTYIADGDPALLPVAKIGDTYYWTLADAVEAAKIGDTIKVIANDASLSAPEGWTISGSTLIPVDKTWHIANLDQLKEFQSAVNGGNTFDGQTVVLDVDIDMASEENWTPIGNAPEKKFAGTFDGQNHTISGLKITGGSYVGLFGYLGAATVQNVALVGANVSGVKRVGALVGQIAGNATIKNCSLDATSSVAGSDSNTGGLIGEASGSIVVTLENLTNNAPVTNTESGTSRAAGILCQATSGASVTLKNCVNNGTITTNDGYAGGIVSAKQGGASLVFDGCSNTGTLANGTKGTGALLAWSCNGSSVTISNYSADVANAIGWLSQDNYDHVFVINGVEHYIRVAKGGAGYTFASRYEAARMMDESYLQEIIGFFNYAKTVNANFAGYPATPVEVLKSAYNTRDESIKGGLFNTDVSSGWPQLLSQYNATSGKSLTADDFAVTWGTRDVLFMVGDAVAKIGNTYYVALADALVAVGTGDVEEITLLKNVSTDAAINVNKVIAIDLNGKTIAATQNDTAGDGVFCVVAPGVLTINDSVGTGVINGVGDNNYNMAIWAKDGGKVVINGGNFTNVGATDKNDPNAHFDLIYVKNGGDVVINGGHFECETPAFTLNSHDTLKGTITVNGGTFVGFDPRNNAAETAGTTFMAPGKFTMANGNNYVVVEPGSYMLNEAYCAKGTVADIDAAVAGAVTLTTIDGVITAKATFTFKVTAVDTVNPENSLYELTGGTLRPGKTVAVKYIDLATGEESWEKPESDTVTFKLVIK